MPANSARPSGVPQMKSLVGEAAQVGPEIASLPPHCTPTASAGGHGFTGAGVQAVQLGFSLAVMFQ